ncbi:MAG: hypothetical protein WD336_03655 [Trueperaceae bacterium]
MIDGEHQGRIAVGPVGVQTDQRPLVQHPVDRRQFGPGKGERDGPVADQQIDRLVGWHVESDAGEAFVAADAGIAQHGAVGQGARQRHVDHAGVGEPGGVATERFGDRRDRHEQVAAGADAAGDGPRERLAVDAQGAVAPLQAGGGVVGDVQGGAAAAVAEGDGGAAVAQGQAHRFGVRSGACEGVARVAVGDEVVGAGVVQDGAADRQEVVTLLRRGVRREQGQDREGRGGQPGRGAAVRAELEPPAGTVVHAPESITGSF